MNSVKHNLNGHSVFSPSSSKMWLTCSGSLIANMLERQNSGETSNFAAAQGTVAHKLAEKWLNDDCMPIELLGEVRNEAGFEIEIDDEMFDCVQQYVSWCQNQNGTKFVEVKSDFSHLTPIPNQHGTSDHVCCTYGKLTITDLKYGIGVKVYAENNTQMQIYALGVLKQYDWLYDFKTVEMRICQPRLNHFDTWEIPVEKLLEFGEYVRKRAIDAWQDDAPRTPSEDGCRFCKVRATCPTLAAEMTELVTGNRYSDDDIFEALENGALEQTRDISALPQAELEIIFSKIKMVKSYFDEIEKKVFDFLLKGGKMHTLKLVTGRKSRSWQDEAEASKVLSELGLDYEEINPRSMISVSAAEKLLKKHKIKDDVSGLIASRNGKPTIASIDDKRAEWQPQSDDDIWDSEED